MRSNFQNKIIKLCITEILLQIGYERATTNSLNILVSAFTHRMTELLIHFAEHNSLELLLFEFIGSSESYQFGELASFLDAQRDLQVGLLEKHALRNGQESILHILRVIPRNISLRSKRKVVCGNILLSEETDERQVNDEVGREIVVDEYMEKFINECMAIKPVQSDIIINSCNVNEPITKMICYNESPLLKLTKEEYDGVLAHRKQVLSNGEIKINYGLENEFGWERISREIGYIDRMEVDKE
ncbi:hypothetical protein TCON_2088 [Astathelohania contejeani]|uniref:Uncharacterized protein n=1 Tax=Astathelohania contejeani TaxID=164912 RepID=A0ABQ7HWZ9_9MICR|nr:hypothetical protein TCON_2088 [Thelohania contejeani]